MKKHLLPLGFLLIFCTGGLFPDSQALADKFMGFVRNYFTGKAAVTLSVSRFENISGLSDFAAQRLYQILVARLETEEKFTFIDTLIGVEDQRGRFNRRQMEVDYYLFLRLVQNRQKLGLGLAVYSRNLQSIVAVKYFEEEIPAGEVEVLKVRNTGFQKVGFSQVVSINVPGRLLDIGYLEGYTGGGVYLLLYPGKIDIMRPEDNRMRRLSSMPLEWKDPYYPAKDPAGRITQFGIQQTRYIAAAGNFSAGAQLFRVESGLLEKDRFLDFIPLTVFSTNEISHLVGARYRPGTNYFQDVILFKPLPLEGKDIFEKTVPGFFSIAFLTDGQALQSFFLVNRDYRLVTFHPDFEPQNTYAEPVGASVARIGNEYLAFSDYTANRDQLQIADVREGGFQVEFRQPLEREIRFLRDGQWEGIPGVWVLAHDPKREDGDQLLFYGKK